MIRLALVFSAGLLGIAVVVATTVARPSPPDPGVRVVSKKPLALRGHHFQADERVQLVVTSKGTKRVRRMRADSSGSFLAEFPGMTLERCSGDLEVSAVGSRGSRAGWTLRRLSCPDRAPARADCAD